jgi:serine-type D-Ala-D-Ala carboxypeptidase (penicillin-binding protein 5/6)
MLPARDAVLATLAVMVALPLVAAGFLLARAGGTRPPSSVQAHSSAQAASTAQAGSASRTRTGPRTRTDSRTRTTAGTRTVSRSRTAAGTRTAAAKQAAPARQAAPGVVSGPAGIQAKGAALADAATGQILWSTGLNTERPIGSIVKVMTALVVIQAGGLNREITVPESVIAYLDSQNGPSTAGLIVGDRLTARDLLEALLLPSGCDAAYTLAQAYGPGIDAFIAKMNAEARRLGLTGTHFSNFDGMPWPGEYSTWSTPANLITLGRYAMSYPAFAAIVGQVSYSIPAGDGHHGYSWQNTNPLIGVYPGATGIKTGDTRAAGNCLLFEATRDGRTLIGVALGTPGGNVAVTGPVATRLLNWGFSHFGPLS